MSINSITPNHQYLQQLKQRAGTEVNNAVRLASAETGVDFAYLMEQAAVESNFDTDAKAKTSSATGLYQFINSTWMDMIETHGEKHGVNTDASKSDLLALRNDPKIAALMAAEFAGQNKDYLEQHYNGEVGSTELYMAHFLGANGAAQFLNAAQDNPSAIAADIFPKAALANRNVFYDRDTGQPKTLKAVYDSFDAKFKADDLPALAEQDTTIQEARKPRQALRDFISSVPFQADRARAEALGAILVEGTSRIASHTNHQTPPPQNHDNRSLFQQLQYKHASAHPSIKTINTIKNTDFVNFYFNKNK